MNAADSVLVSPITFFEIAQKVRLGKWPEMEPFVSQLPALLDRQGGSVAGFGPVTRPGGPRMRFVSVKSAEQQAEAMALPC
jgi:hypothetical protein